MTFVIRTSADSHVSGVEKVSFSMLMNFRADIFDFFRSFLVFHFIPSRRRQRKTVGSELG